MLRYLLVDLKIMTRIPLSVFFTLAFPIIMMVIIVVSYGNMEIGGGYHLIDKYFLVAIGMGVLPLTLVSFPIWIANRIEDGSLKRLTFFGVRASYVIVSDVIVHVIMGLLTFLICFLFASVVFGLKTPDPVAFLAFVLQYMLVLVVYLLVGAVLALLFPSQQVLMPLGLTLMFMLFLFCGVFGSVSELPDVVQAIGNYIPMKYAMNDFFDIWQNKSLFDLNAFIVSLVYIGISVLAILGLWLYRKNKL